MLKRQNPLTAKGAKIIRRGRKEFNINSLSLRTLRNPLRSLRLKGIIRQLKCSAKLATVLEDNCLELSIHFALILYIFA
jgi:hypothetical protein